MWRLHGKLIAWALAAFLGLCAPVGTSEATVGRLTKLTAADIDWLATDSGYIEGLMTLQGEPIALDLWQRSVIDDQADFIVVKKGRQVGYSFGPNAAAALARSHLIPRNLSVFTSSNLEDAREKIRYARELYDGLPRCYCSRLITDNKFELEFANGSRIVTMFMPRGKGPADVYIDEMAYMKRARDIYRAAMGMTVRGGRLHIGSTPAAKAGLFYEIVTNEKNAFSGFSRHEVPWWLSSALCRNVLRASVEAPVMTTHERVYAFGAPKLIALYENTYLEEFRTEFELSFLDDEQAFFPLDLIFRCVDPELALYATFEEFRAQLKGVPYAGFDVGRRKNPSVLAILELLGDKYYLRMLIPMAKMEFETQRYHLSEALRILPIARMCIDETGIGMNLAEDLSKQYPGIVIPVNFAGTVEAEARERHKKATVAVKERLATNVKIALERGRLALVQDRELIKEIHSVKTEVSPAGTIRYAVEKNEQHHADRFWAVALAMFEMKAHRVGVI